MLGDSESGLIFKFKTEKIILEPVLSTRISNCKQK